LNISDMDHLSSIEQDRYMEFSKSIIEGVEIKRCRNIPHAYKSHVHNELSLGYIVEGSTDLSLNDKTIHYGTGDGVIIPPLMTHRCAPKEINHWSYVMLFVDPSYYCDVIGFSQAQRLTGDQAQKLKDFIEQLLIEEIPEVLENKLVELLLEFGEKDIAEITTTDTSDIVTYI
jgi:hypothetical protein